MNIYTLEFLTKLLENNSYSSGNFEWLRRIKILENKFHVSFIWADKWYNEHSLYDASASISNQSAHNDCVGTELYYDETINKIFLEVKIYDPLRITYTLVVTEWDDIFKQCVESLLDRKTELFLKEREKRKQDKLNKLARNSIIKNLLST
jgi:hypothetical protein